MSTFSKCVVFIERLNGLLAFNRYMISFELCLRTDDGLEMYSFLEYNYLLTYTMYKWNINSRKTGFNSDQDT